MQDYSKYHELLELAFKAKEKGIDIFFRYSPHVQIIDVEIYKNGWGNSKETSDKRFTFYLDDEINPESTYEAISYLMEVERG